jgi:hypothetical protein
LILYTAASSEVSIPTSKSSLLEVLLSKPDKTSSRISGPTLAAHPDVFAYDVNFISFKSIFFI